MTHLTITLPDHRPSLHRRTTRGTYSSADELLTALIIQEQKRQAKQKLNHMIRKGLNSGTPIEATDEWWEQKRVSIQ